MNDGEHIPVPPKQIPTDERDNLLERLADRIKDYIAGDHFENDLHKLACDELGIDPAYDPTKIDEENPSQVLVSTAYYNAYALYQAKILAAAAEGM